MPPARKSAAKTTAARASKATQGVRARAASTRQATRREVEQSIARFEKQLDGANDALKALGGHLGRGATGSYKEVTTALTALRREASKTNKQALKDFDKLRAAVTQQARRVVGVQFGIEDELARNEEEHDASTEDEHRDKRAPARARPPSAPRRPRAEDLAREEHSR